MFRTMPHAYAAGVVTIGPRKCGAYLRRIGWDEKQWTSKYSKYPSAPTVQALVGQLLRVAGI
jgi:hypothetical protein